MIKKWKKQLSLIKYPLTILLLYLVARQLDFPSLADIIKKLSLSLIVSLILVSIVKIFLQYTNWKLFLSLYPEIKETRQERLTSFFAGTSLRLVTPGGLGVYGKIMMLSKPSKHSFYIVTYEKLVQTWTIFFLASIAAALFFSDISNILKAVLIFSLLLVPLLFFLFSHQKSCSFCPANRKNIIPSILLQILINLLTVLQYYIFLNSYSAFEIKEALSTVPLVQFANLIPLTVSGLGLREGIAVEVYNQIGISGELAVACSLFIYLLSNFLPAITGVFFLSRLRIRREVPDQV